MVERLESKDSVTPGEWRLGMRDVPRNGGSIYCMDGETHTDDTCVAQVYGLYDRDGLKDQDNWTALNNGFLMAASKELRDAVLGTINLLEFMGLHREHAAVADLLQECREAIEKSYGRGPMYQEGYKPDKDRWEN